VKRTSMAAYAAAALLALAAITLFTPSRLSLLCDRVRSHTGFRPN